MRIKMTALRFLVRAGLSTWLWVVLLALVGGAAVAPAEAATFTVVSADDTDDPYPGDGQCGGVVRYGWFVVKIYPCTLRAAITEINALRPPPPGSPHTINFNIGYGVQTISPASALPTITQPVVISGDTQSILQLSTVLSPRTAACRKVIRGPCIQLNGTNAGSAVDGLTLAGGNSTVRGLAVYNFGGSGINVGSDNNLIIANFIGIDHNGTYAQPNKQHGVFLSFPPPSSPHFLPASNNVVSSNVISGNSVSGVVIDATGSTDDYNGNMARRTFNQVFANCIGTDATCTAPVANGLFGVLINNASHNYIGGDAAGNVSGNVIGSSFYGVSICPGAEKISPAGFSCNNGNVQVWENKVLGNYIGTNWFGAILGNSQLGIDLGGAVSAAGCQPPPDGSPPKCLFFTEVGGNTVSNNGTGGILNSIAVGGYIHDNVVLGNANGSNDVEEDNPPPACGNDTWVNNRFDPHGATGAGASCI